MAARWKKCSTPSRASRSSSERPRCGSEMSPWTGLRGPAPCRGGAARHPAGGVAQALELVLRALAHEHMDVTFALEQALDEMPADEAGGSRDEVAHPVDSPSAVLVRGVGPYLGFSAPGRGRAWSTRARRGSARRRAA